MFRRKGAAALVPSRLIFQEQYSCATSRRHTHAAADHGGAAAYQGVCITASSSTSRRSRGTSNVSAYCWSSSGAFHANFSRTAQLYHKQEVRMVLLPTMAALLHIKASFSLPHPPQRAVECFGVRVR
ncbi:unnamed protein product [Rangifer tarandus platyrhynchus]|uniref:Uncharacterized protein n=1 Tax=Rangifer tarandus platyrhynchus TaxID=3082113 RepID=A0ABN8XLE5_RANTA|nr:unnamed protein product [Rangifer tarandus platyrhynchus]